ncbi:MAG TPA: ribonuclease domain-containing protein [Stellaceae bacterium]|nr:ribonuclease domain-containing protein [Stellaceae bacterium]
MTARTRPFLFIATLWLALAGIAGPGAAQPAADETRPLLAFAETVGLRDVVGFAAAVLSLREIGRLPPRYAAKEEARAHGWRGGGLCGAWPGHVIGGDVFHNFAGRLPAAPARRYREADLDADCRSRGPKRLVYSNDGLIYVTIDHYKSYISVP